MAYHEIKKKKKIKAISDFKDGGSSAIFVDGPESFSGGHI